MRILSWNAQGDVGTYCNEKVQELKKVMEYWEKNGDPIVIICLQEVNGEKGALSNYLQQEGWDVRYIAEGANGYGRDQVIAAAPKLTIQKTGVVDLSPFEDPKTIASLPCRVPFYAAIDVPHCGQIYVATWHATLGSCQEDDIRGFSTYATDLHKGDPSEKIIIAADLNYRIGALNVPGMFPDYKGWSHGLDHIIAVNIGLLDGQNSTGVHSDHEMISARLNTPTRFP